MKKTTKNSILILLTCTLMVFGLGMNFQPVSESSSGFVGDTLRCSASNAYYKANNGMIETQLLRDSTTTKTTYTCR